MRKKNLKKNAAQTLIILSTSGFLELSGSFRSHNRKSIGSVDSNLFPWSSPRQQDPVGPCLW